MKRSICLIALLSLLSFTLGRAQSDTAAFRAAVAVPTPSGKISALVQFLGQFPRSPFRSGAYNALFGLYVDQGSEAGHSMQPHNTCRRWRPKRGWVPTTSSHIRSP